MNRPEDLDLSREDGEALIERLETETWTAEDRQVLIQVVRLYFWLLFALKETKLSLNRFRIMLFGEKAKSRKPPAAASSDAEPPGDSDSVSASDSSCDGAQASSEDDGTASALVGETPPEDGEVSEADPDDTAPRRGHGRLSAEAYTGAERVECRHEELAPGDRCPVCGIGWLYSLPPGNAVRIQGHALLSAIRYEVEKLRCSACGERFTASLPEEAGEEKYHPSARAALALSRYFLSVPFYRLETYQAMVGVPVPDATQWDQVEGVADSAYMVFEHLVNLAAQGHLIYQDDTPVRILSLIRENQDLETVASPATGSSLRTGMHSTALVVESGGHTICLYFCGRAHAGENLKEVLAKREAGLDPPLVMSDALAHNEVEGIEVVRCHCMAHGRRQFTEIEAAFPEACEEVVAALKQVFDHEEQTQKDQMNAQERLAYHQTYSAPIMAALKSSMEHQQEQREVEPNSSLGKAFSYWLGHWSSLTRFLSVPDAPLENNTAERALKLIIRQRKNSLFYATPHSAYVASLLTSLIATCIQAGVNAMDYLVALQANRSAVFANPADWLPWTFQATLACR
jgi:transposase